MAPKNPLAPSALTDMSGKPMQSVPLVQVSRFAVVGGFDASEAAVSANDFLDKTPDDVVIRSGLELQPIDLPRGEWLMRYEEIRVAPGA